MENDPQEKPIPVAAWRVGDKIRMATQELAFECHVYQVIPPHEVPQAMEQIASHDPEYHEYLVEKFSAMDGDWMSHPMYFVIPIDSGKPAPYDQARAIVPMSERQYEMIMGLKARLFMVLDSQLLQL